MMYRIFAAAFAAGLLAAALISVIEVYTTSPMILKGETFETAPVCAAADCAVTQPEDWKPTNGIERFLFTVLANSVTGIAFALLVVVGLTMGKGKVDLNTVDHHKGMLIAVAGFAVFTLAPVLGLPPELPGMPTSDLQMRQIWWAVTVALSIAGLASLVLADNKALKVLGVVLIIAPHVWGAPHAPTEHTLIPPELSAEFATATVVVSALFWAFIGAFAPYFFYHFKGKSEA